MSGPAARAGKPLSEKLGLKAGLVATVIDPPQEYRRLLGHVPLGVLFVRPEAEGLDFAHLFVRDRATLEAKLTALRSRVQPRGMIWVSWPKKASGMASELTEDVVREVAIACGLVDVKVCAVDSTWSGLKLVFPRKDRP